MIHLQGNVNLKKNILKLKAFQIILSINNSLKTVTKYCKSVKLLSGIVFLWNSYMHAHTHIYTQTHVCVCGCVNFYQALELFTEIGIFIFLRFRVKYK